MAAEPGPDGVQRQVAGELHQVAVVFDRHGHELVPDRVPRALVQSVERAGVAAVQPFHAQGQGLRCAHHSVPVGIHEAERPHLPAVTFSGAAQQGQEHDPVAVLEEHRLAIVAVHSDVLDRAVVIDSRLPRHGSHATDSSRSTVSRVVTVTQQRAHTRLFDLVTNNSARTRTGPTRPVTRQGSVTNLPPAHVRLGHRALGRRPGTEPFPASGSRSKTVG
jgi:hypothetical protein